MVFIDKSTPHSTESKQRLEDWKKEFLLNGETLEQLYVKEGQKGSELWKIFRDEGFDVQEQLRKDLSTEQEHICCYCGQKLKSETRIEHFLSKAKEFAKRVFNYDNLLLSCEGEIYDKVQYGIGKMETLQEFAERNKLTIKHIRGYNSSKKLKNFKIGDKIYYGEYHCDPHKGQVEDKEKKEIPIINPSQFKECWQYFTYDYNGAISVNNTAIKDNALKNLAINAIRVLNLNAKELTEKRKKALTDFSDDWNNVAEAYQYDLETYFSDQFLSPKQPFCFVNYHFIQQLMKG
jgi:hypothetical protein